jgi:hexosaminidase
MPGRETFEDFKKMIDFIVYYKYNKIILEIGGAMEYKRHPKINEKWIEFCKECGKFCGRVDEIQNGYHWDKNSIHYENGDGAYLTQDECREIIAYCEARGIEIIPECPSLSHTDYICLAYPEIAERQDDPYPDTYCPSNPRSYEIMFDVLDEVIEVFNPKTINIGHDEFYSVGVCDKCKGKSHSSIYADDVKKISEYLASKGISTMMWGEKLLKARFPDGRKIGGWYEPHDCNGVWHQIPPMYDCADKMPKGVTYLHWYWEFGEHLDDEYHSRNYPVVFGNFSALGCDNYRTRINRGVKGAFFSNWGSNAEEYMQRNGQFLGLVTTGYALWSDTYDDSERASLNEKAKLELYNRRNSKIKNPLRVRHYANYIMEHPSFWCGIFIEDAIYLLGNYKVTYSDGTTANLPVKFGTNIGPRSDAVKRNVTETVYSTLPIKESKGYTYEHLYENPYPEKKIERIDYVPAAGKEDIKVEFEFYI